MKVLKILILLVLSLLIASSEITFVDEGQPEFLATADCGEKGKKCSASSPCCDGLTCSEFKICRS